MMIVREGMRLAVLGVAIGLVLGAAGARLIAKFLFSVSPFDAIAFTGMSLSFVIVALVASYLRTAGSGRGSHGRIAGGADPHRSVSAVGIHEVAVCCASGTSHMVFPS